MSKQLSNQEARVLAWLQRTGSLNPMDALKLLGIYRLSSVIHNLRKAGYIILIERVPVTNRFGEPCHYGLYTLAASLT